MHQATARLLQFVCCLLVLAGLSGSAVRGQESLDAAQPPAQAAEEFAPVPDEDPTAGPPVPDSTGGDAREAVAPEGGTETSGGADGTAGQDAAVDGKAVKGTPVVEDQAAAPAGPPGSWRLVFDEEFDALNPAVWTPYWFRDCHPESKKNGVKTCSSNVSVVNGEARLQLSDPASGALLSTNPKDGAPGHAGFEYTSGYVEARIFFPGTCSGGIDNWPAWWTVGQNFPDTGEIDIAEPLKGTMSTVYHSPGGHPAKWFIGCFAGGFHTYGVHRKAGSNDIYFDGKLVFSYPTTDGNAPHYLILNVGLWGDRQTLGPAGAVRVDWVRAWQ